MGNFELRYFFKVVCKHPLDASSPGYCFVVLFGFKGIVFIGESRVKDKFERSSRFGGW